MCLMFKGVTPMRLCHSELPVFKNLSADILCFLGKCVNAAAWPLLKFSVR